MSILRDDIIRPAVGCRIGPTATIIAVTDTIIDGELLPHVTAVIAPHAGKGDPRFIEVTVDDPRTIEPPLAPGLVGRRLLQYVANKRGAFTQLQDRAVAAAGTLLEIGPPPR